MATGSLSREQRDCLQEICNVALGQVASALAKRLNVFVHLPIPVINIVDSPSSISTSLRCYKGRGRVHAAVQYFQGEGLSGLALVLLADSSVVQLSDLASEGAKDAESILADVCMSLSQNFLDALKEHWQWHFTYQPPLMSECETLKGLLKPLLQGAPFQSQKQVLMIEVDYQLESHVFDADFVMLLPASSIGILGQHLDRFLSG